MKFRKKSVIVDAVQWRGKSLRDARALYAALDVPKTIPRINGRGSLIIGTLKWQYEASIGDWIIKDVEGRCYPCKPDIFEAIYEPV